MKQNISKLLLLVTLFLITFSSFADPIVAVNNGTANNYGSTSFKLYRNGVFQFNMPAVGPNSRAQTFGYSNSRLQILGPTGWLIPSEGYQSDTASTYEFYWYGTNQPCKINWTFNNNDTGTRSIFVTKGGVVQNDKSFVLAPGENRTVQFNIECADFSLWSYYFLTYGDVQLGTNNPPILYQPNEIPTNPPPFDITAPPPTTYNPTNQVLPIKFSNTNDTQEGSSAVYDAVTKFAAQNHQDLLRIAFSNSITANVSNNITVTNINSVTNENNFFDTNIVNAINALHHSQTNHSGATNYNNSAGVNQAAAISAGNSAIATTVEKFDSAITGMGSPPDISLDGSPELMEIAFMDTTLNLDPEVRFPGAMSMIKALITLVATLYFLINMTELYLRVATTYATAQTGGVPNMEGSVLGTGGNIAGVVAALVISAAFIAIWVLTFDSIFSLILGTGDTIQSLMSGMDAKATLATGAISNPITRYLLDSVFPLSLLLSYAWTRIVAQFTIAKLIIVSSSISRFLFGK